MRKVHQVEKEVAVFREKVLKKARTADFSDDMQDLVQFVVDRNQVKRFPRNITDFINLLTKVRDAAESVYKPEVMVIDSAIETFKTYLEFMGKIRAKLTSAVDEHVGKYCHSFCAETGVYEIPSVLQYENNITKWRGQIREAFILLDDIMRNIKESSMTMELFLQNYPRVVHYMGLSLEVLPRIFNAIKDWVTADEAYIRHIQDDMSDLKREKMALDCTTRRHKMAAGGIQSKVTRSQHHTKKLKEKLLRARDERRQCRRRQLTLIEASSKVAAELNERRQALDRSMQQFYRAGGPTQSAKVKLLDSSTSLSGDIAKLEKKMNALNADLRTVKIERMAAQKEFHKMQVLAEKNSRLEMDIRDDALDASQDVLDIDEERRILGGKVIALARIKAIKSDLRTVKIIHSEGYTPGRKFDVPVELEEACLVAAQDVGPDWPGMPLSPRRDPVTGKPETSGQQTSSSRGGVGGGSLRGRAKAGCDRNKRIATTEVSVVMGDDDCPTYRSLDRWQRVSQEASGNALGRITRSIRAVRGEPDMIAGSGGSGGNQEFKVITVN